jgi:hypothetical protein
MAQENRSWGYDRIAGALAHLGYTISDQTVGNILKRQGILASMPPTPGSAEAAFTPVKIPGPPLSQTILDDRR